MAAIERGDMQGDQTRDGEVSVHKAAIEALAVAMGRSVSEISLHYEREIARLQKGARVHDFLSVVASRHVRDILRELHG